MRGNEKIELLKELMRRDQTNQSSDRSVLANIIERVLISEGYNTKLNPGNCPADKVCIEAIKNDRLLSPEGVFRLFIEVVDGSTESECMVIEGLIRMRDDPEYADHSLILMSCEQVFDDVKKEAAIHKIRVLDGDNLVDWIFESLDNYVATAAHIKHQYLKL